MSRGYSQMSLRVPITPMVRRIMLINVGIYALCVGAFSFKAQGTFDWLSQTLYLHPPSVVAENKYWMIATYAWFHDIGALPWLSLLICAGVVYGFIRLFYSQWARREPMLFWIAAFFAMMLIGSTGFGAPLHLGGNLIGLYFFGHLFEKRWGDRRFLLFWILCTVAGGVFETLVHLWWARETVILGSSAGVLGLLAAFSVYHPNDQVLYGMVVPIKGKYFIWIAIAFDLLGFMGNSRVAIFAHLGGIIMGVLLTTGYWRPGKAMKRLGIKTAKKKSSHLRVVPPPDDDEPPRYLH